MTSTHPPDPVIDEIREIRHRISAEFDHDPGRLVAYYMELQQQKEYRERLVATQDAALETDQPAA